jgi:8-oxo-dGTP pyrophosphatase MutT (NUDIX family)
VTAGDRAEPIQAAGGVLWRDSGDRRQFAVIHRPKYDDWTLPKGKLDPGETHEQAAMREVSEETGFSVELGAGLGETLYEHDDRPKHVRYWGMRAVGGRFQPNREVDDIRWLPLDEARRLLTYDRDRAILDRFTGGGAPGD